MNKNLDQTMDSKMHEIRKRWIYPNLAVNIGCSLFNIYWWQIGNLFAKVTIFLGWILTVVALYSVSYAHLKNRIEFINISIIAIHFHMFLPYLFKPDYIQN